MADDLTAGTTTPAAADPVSPGTTAADEAGGKTGAEPGDTPDPILAELQDLKRQKEEWLRNKSNYEGWERERAELLNRLRPSTTETGSEAVARIQRTVATLQQRAGEGDDVAYTLLQMMNDMQQQPVQIRQELELREVPQDERGEVQRIQREAWEQRGERITPGTARRLLEADRLSKQADALRKREDEIRRTEDAKARGVVQTRTVPVPSNETPSMTFSEFRRAYAEAGPEQREELYKRTAGGTKNLKPD